MTVSAEAAALLDRCGVPSGLLAAGRGLAGGLVARSPLTGETVAELAVATPGEAAAQVERAHAAFLPGARCRRRAAASWCACWARSCAPPRPTSAGW